MMKENGFSTHQLREKCGVDSKTIRRLRANDNMETKTLNKLCTVLDCRLEDIAEYIPDEEGESKGGDLPSWHTTFGESLVCYTFCPGWRGKGAARSGAVTFPHQEIRQWDGAAAIIPLPDFGRDKRYIQPSSPVPPQRHRQRADNRACEPPVWARSKATYWPLVSFALGRFSKSETSPRRSSASFSRSISSPTVCKMASVT